jgi:hypothetical protein
MGGRVMVEESWNGASVGMAAEGGTTHFTVDDENWEWVSTSVGDSISGGKLSARVKDLGQSR